MSYYYNYNIPQTYHHQHYTHYSQHQNWSNYSNGYTAMQHARNWYPDWQASNYRWDSNRNCWVVHMRHPRTTAYVTVYVSVNYGWQGAQNGYWW